MIMLCHLFFEVYEGSKHCSENFGFFGSRSAPHIARRALEVLWFLEAPPTSMRWTHLPRLRKVSALSLSPLSLPTALKRQSKSQSFPGCQRLEAQNWNVESLQDFKPSFLTSNLYIARERSFHKAGNEKEFHQTSRSNSSVTKKLYKVSRIWSRQQSGSLTWSLVNFIWPIPKGPSFPPAPNRSFCGYSKVWAVMGFSIGVFLSKFPDFPMILQHLSAIHIPRHHGNLHKTVCWINLQGCDLGENLTNMKKETKLKTNKNSSKFI